MMVVKRRCYETNSFDETSLYCSKCGYYRSCRNKTLGSRCKCFRACEFGKHSECSVCPAKLECERKAIAMNKNELSKQDTKDLVNHPSHYTQNKFESIDEMMIVFGPEAVYHFCICNAWKYKNRASFKGNFELDMKKADWYLTKAKEIKEGNLWQE